MRILALETTDPRGGVAALVDSKVLMELRLDEGRRSAQTLAPGIETLLKQVGWSPDEVQLVAVSIGPGSFTGLRVGVATAKLFAYAVGAQVLGIDCLEALAQAATAASPTLWTIMDAQRGDVVARRFGLDAAGRRAPIAPQRLLSIEAWLGELSAGDAVIGPVLPKLIDRLPGGLELPERRYWFPSASAIGVLAARRYAEGRRDDLMQLAPRYTRPSAAEEKRP